MSELYLKQYVINISRCLNVTRKADWTFLNNLATFGGFLFSYFPRFTIGSLVQVIILGPFTSQVAVTSKYGAKTQSVINMRPALVAVVITEFISSFLASDRQTFDVEFLPCWIENSVGILKFCLYLKLQVSIYKYPRGTVCG